jgi:Fe-S cluster assembly protein SufD
MYGIAFIKIPLNFYTLSKLSNLENSLNLKKIQIKNTKNLLKNFKKNQKFFSMQIQQNNKISEIDSYEWLNSISALKKNSSDPFIENIRKLGTFALHNTKIPSSNDESWRFTSLKNLFRMRFKDVFSEKIDELLPEFGIDNVFARIVFDNGIYSPFLSFSKNKKEDFFLGKFSDLNEKKKKKIKELIGRGESGINGGFFSILNMAFIDEIIVLIVPSNIKIDEPIQIFFFNSYENNQSCFQQKLIVLNEKFSTVNIIQQHINTKNCQVFENSSINFLLEENSKVDYTLINDVSLNSAIVNSIHIEQKKNSTFNFLSISKGGFFSRINLGVDLNGINSICNIFGINLGKENQQTDFHSRISHNYPKCKSNQIHKNLVSGKSGAVFAGKIQVHQGAFQTESDQLCKTLLLSPISKIDTMPILEINNEDVKCTHGTTVSDLDDEQIFYFQSRGISTEKARYLLTTGFIKDMIIKLPKELTTNILKSLNSYF